MATYHSAENRDDLHSAIEYNSAAIAGKFLEDDIDQILAEVTGENDGCDWYWVLKLKDGTFVLLHGGCDYTGWDCQSSLHVDYLGNIGATDAADRAPETDSYGRHIKQTLLDQIAGTQPFGLYTYPNKEEKDEDIS